MYHDRNGNRKLLRHVSLGVDAICRTMKHVTKGSSRFRNKLSGKMEGL